MILAYPHPHRARPDREGWRSPGKLTALAAVGLIHVLAIGLAARELVAHPPPPEPLTRDPVRLQLLPQPPVPKPAPTPSPKAPPSQPARPVASTPVAGPVLTPLDVGDVGKIVLPDVPLPGVGNGTGSGAGTAPDPVVRAPGLARAPTADEMARFYPDRAQRLGVTGGSVVECAVSAAGRAESCRVVAESPGGYGFGDAALRLADRFRLTPKTVDGKPVAGGVIRIPLRWTLD